MNKYVLILAAVSVTGVGCAHHRDVRPGADGIHHVIVRETDQESAERSAIQQAEHFCKEKEQHAVFVEEKKTQYTGTMDEQTRDTIRKASTAAMVLGGGMGTLPRDEGTRTAGTVVGAAGTTGAIMTSGKDYTADMKFRCQ